MVSRTLFGRLRADNRAAALVEFALIAPVILALVFGSVEATHQIWARGKLHDSASILSDLISRETEMTNDQMNLIMSAMPALLTPHQFRDAQVDALSVLACSESTGAEEEATIRFFVTWSRSWTTDGGVAASTYAVDTEFSDAALDQMQVDNGATLIYVESDFVFLPRFSYILGREVAMEEFAFYQPRFIDRIPYDGVENATPKDCPEYLSG